MIAFTSSVLNFVRLFGVPLLEALVTVAFDPLAGVFADCSIRAVERTGVVSTRTLGGMPLSFAGESIRAASVVTVVRARRVCGGLTVPFAEES